MKQLKIGEVVNYRELLEHLIDLCNKPIIPSEVKFYLESAEDNIKFSIWSYSIYKGDRKVLFKAEVYFTNGCDKEDFKNVCCKKVLLDTFMWGVYNNHKTEIAK